MKYSKEEVLQYAQEEDVKFIRLAFCDVFGKQKNISIMTHELPRAFDSGIAFDASAIDGFGEACGGTLLLHPEPDTLMPLPWRPEHGRVVQMFSDLTCPDGTPFVCDTRAVLKRAVLDAEKAGLRFRFGNEQTFYLFLLDENGKPAGVPCDAAGYMDIAPEDHGENVRREICLTLEEMGIRPERSHHEEGPGQNRIVWRPADALTAADQTQIFQRVVRTVAYRNGLYADFSPKPLENAPGNGSRIRFSADGADSRFAAMLDAIRERLGAMRLFLDPGKQAPDRPIRLTADAQADLAQLCAPDPCINPYLVFALLIRAALQGAGADAEKTPSDPAAEAFLRAYIPPQILNIYSR